MRNRYHIIQTSENLVPCLFKKFSCRCPSVTAPDYKLNRTENILLLYLTFFKFISSNLTHTWPAYFSHRPLTQLSFVSDLMLLKCLYLSHFCHFCNAISLVFLFLFLTCLSLHFPPLIMLELLSRYCHVMCFSFSISLLWPLCSHHSHHIMLSTP